jgi:hypothetical protein
LSTDEPIDSDSLAEEIDGCYAAEVVRECELETIGQLIKESVKDTYLFARGDRRDALEDAAWDAILRIEERGDQVLDWVGDSDGGVSYFADAASAAVEKALREKWRQLARPSDRVRKAGARPSVQRRPVCARPRERRDGSRSRSRACRGDPSDDPDPTEGESPGWDGHEHHLDHLRLEGP